MQSYANKKTVENNNIDKLYILAEYIHSIEHTIHTYTGILYLTEA